MYNNTAINMNCRWANKLNWLARLWPLFPSSLQDWNKSSDVKKTLMYILNGGTVCFLQCIFQGRGSQSGGSQHTNLRNPGPLWGREGREGSNAIPRIALLPEIGGGVALTYRQQQLPGWFREPGDCLQGFSSLKTS